MKARLRSRETLRDDLETIVIPEELAHFNQDINSPVPYEPSPDESQLNSARLHGIMMMLDNMGDNESRRLHSLIQSVSQSKKTSPKMTKGVGLRQRLVQYPRSIFDKLQRKDFLRSVDQVISEKDNETSPTAAVHSDLVMKSQRSKTASTPFQGFVVPPLKLQTVPSEAAELSEKELQLNLIKEIILKIEEQKQRVSRIRKRGSKEECAYLRQRSRDSLARSQQKIQGIGSDNRGPLFSPRRAKSAPKVSMGLYRHSRNRALKELIDEDLEDSECFGRYNLAPQYQHVRSQYMNTQEKVCRMRELAAQQREAAIAKYRRDKEVRCPDWRLPRKRSKGVRIPQHSFRDDSPTEETDPNMDEMEPVTIMSEPAPSRRELKEQVINELVARMTLDAETRQLRVAPTKKTKKKAGKKRTSKSMCSSRKISRRNHHPNESQTTAAHSNSLIQMSCYPPTGYDHVVNEIQERIANDQVLMTLENSLWVPQPAWQGISNSNEDVHYNSPNFPPFTLSDQATVSQEMVLNLPVQPFGAQGSPVLGKTPTNSGEQTVFKAY